MWKRWTFGMVRIISLWLELEVKGRFVDWMQSSSITCSSKLDILPDSEGEGRCVVCSKDLEKGALVAKMVNILW